MATPVLISGPDGLLSLLLLPLFGPKLLPRPKSTLQAPLGLRHGRPVGDDFVPPLLKQTAKHPAKILVSPHLVPLPDSYIILIISLAGPLEEVGPLNKH